MKVQGVVLVKAEERATAAVVDRLCQFQDTATFTVEKAYRLARPSEEANIIAIVTATTIEAFEGFVEFVGTLIGVQNYRPFLSTA